MEIESLKNQKRKFREYKIKAKQVKKEILQIIDDAEKNGYEPIIGGTRRNKGDVAVKGIEIPIILKKIKGETNKLKKSKK